MHTANEFVYNVWVSWFFLFFSTGDGMSTPRLQRVMVMTTPRRVPAGNITSYYFTERDRERKRERHRERGGMGEADDGRLNNFHYFSDFAGKQLSYENIYMNMTCGFHDFFSFQQVMPGVGDFQGFPEAVESGGC